MSFFLVVGRGKVCLPIIDLWSSFLFILTFLRISFTPMTLKPLSWTCISHYILNIPTSNKFLKLTSSDHICSLPSLPQLNWWQLYISVESFLHLSLYFTSNTSVYSVASTFKTCLESHYFSPSYCYFLCYLLLVSS